MAGLAPARAGVRVCVRADLEVGTVSGALA